MKARRLAYCRSGWIALACAASLACDSSLPARTTEPAPSETASSNPDAEPEAESWQAQLEALGYVSGTPVSTGDSRAGGVVHHQEGAASPGLNLFNSRDVAEAQLMTLDGEVVHRWRSDIQGEMVEHFAKGLPSESADHFKGWNHVELQPGGDLLVIGSHHMLMRLDWNSQVLWKLDLAAHHDLAVDRDGVIHVLSDELGSATVGDQQVAFQDNVIVRVSADGEILGRLSLYHALRETSWRDTRLLRLRKQQIRRLAAWHRSAKQRNAYQELYRAATRGERPEDASLMNMIFHSLPEDVFHANSIQLVSDATAGWRAGDYLVSILRFDTVVLIDRETELVKWSWGSGMLDKPHHATQLPNGDILIFDNGVERGWSRIVRLDPIRREIVWSYQADPEQDFFTSGRGGAEPLENGNVLITESNRGRVFEVTPAGDVVWEFLNEVRMDADGASSRPAIYRMARLHPDQLQTLAPQLGKSEDATPSDAVPGDAVPSDSKSR